MTTTLVTYDLGHGIICIDTDYFGIGHASCYLLVRDGEAAFIDTGTSIAAPLLLATLSKYGLDASQVKYVLPTHVHLDHAGGVGAVMQQLPQAQVVVHPRGARHLVDPSVLQASVISVYGEATFRRHLGEIVPVAADRVCSADDGYTLTLGRSELLLRHTDGHAYHHYCVIDVDGNGMFTGDTFGMRLPQFTTAKGDFLFAPTTPTQFDPAAWHASLDTLLATGMTHAYLTHLGRVGEPAHYAKQVRAWIDDSAEMGERAENNGWDLDTLKDAVRQHFHQRLAEHGVRLPEADIAYYIAGDIDLNAQGLLSWRQRLQRNTHKHNGDGA